MAVVVEVISSSTMILSLIWVGMIIPLKKSSSAGHVSIIPSGNEVTVQKLKSELAVSNLTVSASSWWVWTGFSSGRSSENDIRGLEHVLIAIFSFFGRSGARGGSDGGKLCIKEGVLRFVGKGKFWLEWVWVKC